jgi:hypothetical protein
VTGCRLVLAVALTTIGPGILAVPDADGVEDDPRRCVERLAPIPSEELVRESVRVLTSAGHDPESYRVELRMENARHPDSGRMTPDREPSVMFLPLDPANRYPVRVHSAIPCGVGWVWEPERFTAWQTDAVAIASDAARRARPAGAGEIRDVQVAESVDHLGVYVWTTADDESNDPGLTVILRKVDLEVVRVEAGSR